MKRQTGFTLVEISIVLVIIGLLLGGILKGQEMITNARVRNLADQGNGVMAAIFAFQDRYRSYPGDYNQATTNIAGVTVNGDGSGQINTNAERGAVWQHLASAGFINGNFNAAAVAANWNCTSATCATNTYGGGLMITFGSEAAGTTGNSHEMFTGRNIPVGVMAELDRKVDNGIPQTGTFQNGQNINAGTCVAGAGAASTYQVTAANPQGDCGGVYRL